MWLRLDGIFGAEVLQAMQKLQDATPQNWAVVSTEFKTVMETELPETGDQREQLQQAMSSSLSNSLLKSIKIH